MAQLLLIPDPKPLVERLGPAFFRQAPEHPGVYLMRAADGSVIYVGKAKNLRRRLASYRVANPQRLKRRQLRMLRAVEAIEFERCADEPAALAREAELLRSLRPRFNRAGVWPGVPRFLAWRNAAAALELTVLAAADPEWQWHGPLGGGAIPLRAALVRLIWSALNPDQSCSEMPAGWFHGQIAGVACLRAENPDHREPVAGYLRHLFSGDPDPFARWIHNRTALRNHPFEKVIRDADLETVSKAAARKTSPIEPIL